MSARILILALALGACATRDKDVESMAVVEHVSRPAPLPDPLEPRTFEMPETEERTLSNGLRVLVATNEEVPLWDVRLVFDVGGFADPDGKEGLASVTLDLLNDGAADLSSEEISRRLKRLGSEVVTWSDEDGAGVGASGIERNLEETLDLWATIVREPTFPESEWSLVQRQRLANLAASREDPVAISYRVLPVILYGDTYRGQVPTEASYQAITTADMRDFYQRYLGPENAIVLVGGALTADEVVPLLEARLGDWKPASIEDPKPEVALTPQQTPVLYLVDKPGAAQSVVRLVTPTIDRLSPDYFAMFIANMAFGGAFTGRVNMNLREDKGYTYGARCGFTHRYGPGLWACGTSVETDKTGPAISEIQKELAAVRGERPLDEEEVGFYKLSEVRAFPASYELTDVVLGEQANIWRYGLPEDWPERFIPGVEQVSTEAANEALREHIAPESLVWLVVGDANAIRGDLEGLGFTIVELDRDGQPVQNGGK